MSAGRAPFALRADLIWRRIDMGRQQIWVVKDPLTRSFCYFSDQEYKILAFANGRRSLKEIADLCSRQFAAEYISPAAIIRFLADAKDKGVLVVDSTWVHSKRDDTTQVVPAPKRKQTRWWTNPLAIRLPGVNPDRVLGQLVPAIQFLFSPISLGIGLSLAVWGFLIVLSRFDSFVEHSTVAAGRLASGQGFFILVVTISVTKLIHELAHASSCKYFAGECRELGIMLLVGVPCLYCDVSDAWLLKQRWKRIFVSASGMIAELVMAAICSIVWMFALDGPLRDICVTVMIVCSMTTVLFNGNPLLRYDGYYILSDLTGVPNLAAESTGVIRDWLRMKLWGLPQISANDNASVLRRALLALYGISSMIYRMAVYAFVLLLLHRFADDRQLGPAARVVLLIAIGAICYRLGKSLLTPPPNSWHISRSSVGRPVVILGGFFAASICLLTIPLPRSVVAPMSLRPANPQPVFVSHQGELVDSLAEGTPVTKGQIIASLRNPEIEFQLAATRAECESLTAQLRSLQQTRSFSPTVASRIPTIAKALEEARKRRDLQESMTETLKLRSPHNGRLYAPPVKSAGSVESVGSSYWAGTPLDSDNRGAWLSEGTTIGFVGHESSREAVIFVSQQQIDLVRRSQIVRLLLPDCQSGQVRGHVVEVSATAAPELPDELVAMTDRSNTFYQVLVQLTPAADGLPIRLTGNARIFVEHASALTRLRRLFFGAFG